MTKQAAKRLFRSKVLDYWQTKLRSASSNLSSLAYFKPEFMSLARPHPIWTTCGNNSYEVTKAIIQAKFLSGRYRTEKLTRHFASENNGLCSICPDEKIGSVEHILTQCTALLGVRNKLFEHFNNNSEISVTTKSLVKCAFSTSTEKTVQLLLDSSVMPEVISAVQQQKQETDVLDKLFRFTRSWCYSMHRRRLQLQGRWGASN